MLPPNDPARLQAEARLGKLSGAGRAVCPLSKPLAEACQLHAVVRWQCAELAKGGKGGRGLGASDKAAAERKPGQSGTWVIQWGHGRLKGGWRTPRREGRPGRFAGQGSGVGEGFPWTGGVARGGRGRTLGKQVSDAPRKTSVNQDPTLTQRPR